MPRYRDPRAPQGRTVFGGVEFVDGVTADIEPGPHTAELFAAAGISPEQSEPTGAEQTDEPAPPTPRRKK